MPECTDAERAFIDDLNRVLMRAKPYGVVILRVHQGRVTDIKGYKQSQD